MTTTRILLRAYKSPFTAVSGERTFLDDTIGTNAGNLVFSHAAHRILSRVDTTVTGIRDFRGEGAAARADEVADHLVLPLANAFRPSFREELDALTDFVEKLSIPVTVLGVGAQGRLSGNVSKLSPIAESVVAFMRAVLDRSPNVGVRGEHTREYLADLGFGDEHVEVIGCPSLFLRGPELAVRDASTPLSAGSRIAINVSPYVAKMGPVVLENAARYRNLDYFAQDINTLGLMLGGEYAGSGTNVENPITPDHVLYREDRMRFCVDPWTWFEELAGYDFSFGTRIHGNIAALLAGTPAVVLAHDSRTLELAEYYEIPHRKIGSLRRTGADAAALHEGADWGPLQRGHGARWDRFAGFLHAHGLAHAFEDGGAPDAFDREVARVRFPAPVHALPVSRRGGLRSWRVRRRTQQKLGAGPASAATR